MVLWRTIKQKGTDRKRYVCVGRGGCLYNQDCQIKGMLRRWHLKVVREWAMWLVWKRCSRYRGQPVQRPWGGSVLGVLENWMLANVSEGEWGKGRVKRQEIQEDWGVREGGWKGVASLGESTSGMFEKQQGGQWQWSQAPTGESRGKWNQRDKWGQGCMALQTAPRTLDFIQNVMRSLLHRFDNEVTWSDWQFDRIPLATVLRRAWTRSRVEAGSPLQSWGSRRWRRGPELRRCRAEQRRSQIYFGDRAHRNRWQPIHFSTVCYHKVWKQP